MSKTLGDTGSARDEQTSAAPMWDFAIAIGRGRHVAVTPRILIGVGVIVASIALVAAGLVF
jgi:hypothetical protein